MTHDVSAPAPLLDRLIPSAATAVYDMRMLLEAVADEGRFLEIASAAAPNLLTGFLRLGGRTVAVLATQPQERAGILDAPALAKAAGFAAWAARLQAPVLTVIDSPGLMPGAGPEAAALLPAAAALLRAWQENRAPRVTLLPRYARGLVPSLMGLAGSRVLRWPSAESALADAPVITPSATRAALLAAFAGGA
ncbi:carboxyl transferase domain-containing protein [Acidisoma sp. 7E03]